MNKNLPKIEVCQNKMATIEKGASFGKSKRKRICECNICKSIKTFETWKKEWETEIKWEKNHPILTKFKRIWWWIRYGIKNKIDKIPLNIRSFIQRGKKGYAISDVWGFDYYLANIIEKGLIWLKINGHGLPTWKEGKSELQASNEWDIILNSIIHTFRIAKKICEGDLYYIPTKDWTEKEYKKLKDLYKNNFRPMSLEETIEFETGFDLFKEWFFALWD